MLEQIDSPPTVLAFRAIGKIGKDDYETVLEPAVSAVVAERGEVRLVVVLGEEYERYTPGAAWEDTKPGLGRWSESKRIGLVTNHDCLRHAVDALGWMMPGEVTTFPLAEAKAAVDCAR